MQLQGNAGVTLRPSVRAGESVPHRRGRARKTAPERKSPEDCTGGEELMRPHRRAGQRKQNRLHEGEGGREEG
ncbi:MAG: hypothetical protein HXK88_07520 [Lachnospiraceae bacterium]|nr:hypothetical protein [Lachnospiraceae bacterium]